MSLHNILPFFWQSSSIFVVACNSCLPAINQPVADISATEPHDCVLLPAPICVKQMTLHKYFYLSVHLVQFHEYILYFVITNEDLTRQSTLLIMHGEYI